VVKVSFNVPPDVADKLRELAGSPRKQGEYLTGLIRGVYEVQQAGEEGAGAGQDLDLRFALSGLAAKVVQVEGRLAAVERYQSAVLSGRNGT
jgi:hypothetical protein